MRASSSHVARARIVKGDRLSDDINDWSLAQAHRPQVKPRKMAIPTKDEDFSFSVSMKFSNARKTMSAVIKTRRECSTVRDGYCNVRPLSRQDRALAEVPEVRS